MAYAEMSQLVGYLASRNRSPNVIEWASPVPYFGNLKGSVVATVGINPSDREFVDGDGIELKNSDRRLQSLKSLRVSSWTDVTGSDIARIVADCDAYFDRNPYRRWFDVLDRVLRTGGATYYAEPGLQRSCHLDLCAFATTRKWGQLSTGERRELLLNGRNALINLIRDSSIRVLILNGRSVIQNFQILADVRLKSRPVPEWNLRRASRGCVVGEWHEGLFDEMASVRFDREVTVIGFNHNLQSTYGVSAEVREKIAAEVGGRVALLTNG